MKATTIAVPQTGTPSATMADLRAAVRKSITFMAKSVASIESSAYICTVHHSIQATVSPSASAVGLFCGHGSRHTLSSVPRGALMRPQPVSGGEQRGAELFPFPTYIQVSF